MAFCVNCGNKLESGAKFCTNCGHPAIINQGQNIPQQTVVYVQAPQQDSWEGSIAVDNLVLEIRNMNGYNLKTKVRH